MEPLLHTFTEFLHADAGGARSNTFVSICCKKDFIRWL